MRTDSVKKYVIPNIPYLFIGWACLKLGTAYRLAPGVDLPHKLIPAFFSSSRTTERFAANGTMPYTPSSTAF